jgi:hypothetical protein
MPRPEPTNVWTHLSDEEVCRRLPSIGLTLCESDRVLICTRCKYALQPSGQTVSKRLCEKRSLPARERACLNLFVRNLNLPDPNLVPKRLDGDPAHPHVLAQSGFTCLQCDYRTTSGNLVRRHLSHEREQQFHRSSTANSRCWSEATLQSWTQNGKREFWIVASSKDEEVQAAQQSLRRKESCRADMPSRSRACYSTLPVYT